MEAGSLVDLVNIAGKLGIPARLGAHDG